MVPAEASPAWHLKRGKKVYSPVSHRELRLLAELGHLRPDDSLWRAGLAGWTPASSVPGIPTLARHDSKPKPWGLTTIGGLLLAASKEFFRRASNANWQACSIRGELQLAYQWAAASLPKLDLMEAACRRPLHSILAGLLIIAVAVGILDLTMKSSFVTGSNSATSKFQDRPSNALAASMPQTNSVQSRPAIDLKQVEVFSVSSGHPTGGFVVASRQPSESETKPVEQDPRPPPASQPAIAATSGGVPLPTRKPNEPFKAQADNVTPKRTAQRQKLTKPKSMQFGTIGYNYNPQR
jgi:hypothetical protein